MWYLLAGVPPKLPEPVELWATQATSAQRAGSETLTLNVRTEAIDSSGRNCAHRAGSRVKTVRTGRRAEWPLHVRDEERVSIFFTLITSCMLHEHRTKVCLRAMIVDTGEPPPLARVFCTHLFLDAAFLMLFIEESLSSIPVWASSLVLLLKKHCQFYVAQC